MAEQDWANMATLEEYSERLDQYTGQYRIDALEMKR
jgi:hypothetical protein